MNVFVLVFVTENRDMKSGEDLNVFKLRLVKWKKSISDFLATGLD